MKEGTVIAEPGKPLRFPDSWESQAPPHAEQKDAFLVADALHAYRVAARNLLSGKYACYADIMPQHLRNKCNIFVLRCSDGVFVRHEAAQGAAIQRVAGTSAALAEVAPHLSEHVVRFGPMPNRPDSKELGPKLVFGLEDAAGARSELLTFYPVIFASANLPDGFQIPQPPARPICLASIQNEITVQLDGLVNSSGHAKATEKTNTHRFLASRRLELPVGWLAIEIYPALSDDHWNPAYASIWAELDILAIAARHNLHENRLHELDPRAETRRQYGLLLREFEHLLNGPEEPLHQFLRQHPELISPTSDKQWSKVPFGATKSDFVFREPHNDYELVELEAPARQLFRQDGQQHADLTHAVDQTIDWVRYIEDNKRTVEDELGLSGISINPRRLIVIGRSKSLTEENRRKLTALLNGQPKLRILTYDDLLAGARANLERVLGPLSLTGQNLRIHFFKDE